MSEPEVKWYVDRIKDMLKEIDGLISERSIVTNSIKEIILHDTNEIEINLYTVIRKLKNGEKYE